MPKQVLTQCTSCRGTGKVSLEGALLDTLSKFSGKTRLTCADLHDPGRGVTKNATNNRLEKLRGFGLLLRERKGREWSYYRAPEGTPPPPAEEPKERKSRNGGDGAAAESAKRAKANAARKPKK